MLANYLQYDSEGSMMLFEARDRSDHIVAFFQ